MCLLLRKKLDIININTIKIVKNNCKFVDITTNNIKIDTLIAVNCFDMEVSMFDGFKNIIMTVVDKVAEKIEKHHENIRLIDLMGLLVSAFTLTTYCTISPILAEYQGKKFIYWTAAIAIIIMFLFAIWEIICLIGCDIWKRLFSFLGTFKDKIITLCNERKHSPQWTYILLIVSVVAVGCWILLMTVKKTDYYASIVEVYGIPVGVGEPLSPEEIKSCSSYWKIDDYPFQGRMELTYGNSYHQSDIIKEYSSLYDMSFFQPADRIVYKYRRNKSKFLSLNDENAYMSANNNKFREPLEISYFNGNGKLLLELKKQEDSDEFKILQYASDSMPQLLNSTLLRIPSNEEENVIENMNEQISRNAIENSILLQQIEVSYNIDGLPETRRINPRVYNLCGVNGERYVYNQNKQMTALYYLDINGNPVCNKSGIMMVSFEYGENNRLSCIRYFSDENGMEKVEGYNRVFCEKYEYDANGNLCRRKQLSRNENKWYDKNGVCEYQYTYDHGKLIRETFLDVSGNKIRKKELQTTSLEYSEEIKENGKKMIEVTFDSVVVSSKENMLMTVKDTKNKGKNKEYVIPVMASVSKDQKDKKENKEEKDNKEESEDNADIDGSTIRNRDDVSGYEKEDQEETSAVVQIDQEEDNEVSREYTSVCYFFDPDKRMAETSYYNGDDRALSEDKFFKEKVKYDSQFRVETKSYFNKAEEHCNINGEYSQINIIYASDHGDVKERIEYRDKNEELALNTRNGYAYVTYKSCDEEENSDYNTILLEYYDQYNKLIRLPDKEYQKIKLTYNKSGFLIREAYLIEDENKKECSAYRKDYMVSEIAYEYSDDGNQTCIEYRDDMGNPINRYDTGYAMVYQEFESGHPVRVYYKGYEDQILVDVPDKSTGIASVRYVYANGKKTEEHYFDTKGAPALCSDGGYAIQKYKYNNKGLIESRSFYGTDGNLILRKDTGYAAIQYEYDKLNRQILRHFYGTDHKSIISWVYYCAGMQFQYDDKGNQTDILYLDKNDNLMLRIDLGYAWVHRVYDQDGNIIRENYLDQDKNPIESRGGRYAFYEAEYEEGNLVRTEYRDRNKELVLRKEEGYAVAKFEYSDRDNPDKCTEQCYFDTDGVSPVINTKYHCAGFQYEYDRKGNLESAWYLDFESENSDTDPEPTYIMMTRSDLGYAKVCKKYDDYGNLTGESYFDTEGIPVLCKEGGYALFEDQFNDNGNCERNIYKDTKGELVLRKDRGYAAAEYKFDDFGRCIWVAYYGTDYNPDYEIDHEYNRDALIISSYYECAGFRYQYDEAGNRTDISYVDIDGNIMVRRDLGYARIHRDYDSLGNLIKESYYDANNNPTTCNSGGYAVCQYAYQNTKCIEYRYYDTNGDPVLHKEEGCAVRRVQYNLLGQRISDSYYGVDGRPVINTKYHCAAIAYEYDCFGNETDIRYKDTRGNLMNRSDLGYAHIRKEYDTRGNVIKGFYYDTEERLTLHKESGIAYYINKFDNNGNWRLGENYGKNRELKVRKDRGYAVTEIFYNKYGQREKEYFYGADGKTLIISPEYHCAGFEYEYDVYGNQENTIYIGIGYKPMNRLDFNYSQHVLEITYDSEKNLEIQRGQFFDVDGNPAKRNGRGDIAYEEMYQFGNWVKGSYYEQWGYHDDNKKLTIREDENYAVIEREYDRYGNLIKVTYYDENNQSMIIQENGKMTCAGYVYEYDEKGNRTDIRYLDTDGMPMTREDLGYAQVCIEYDEQGNKIEERYYSLEHKPALYKKGGYASYDYVYENGRCVETRYYDEKKNLVLRSDENYAIQKEKFDTLGRCILSSYFDTENKPIMNTRYCCSTFEYRYDELGNETDIIYRNTDGNVMVREDLGYAWIERKYDEWGRIVLEKYYDAEKNPTTDRNGYAEIRYEYGKWGISKTKYFDLNGVEVY